jgi:peptidoglycan hydrolase-like protein with peptidoglycan-binding domain
MLRTLLLWGAAAAIAAATEPSLPPFQRVLDLQKPPLTGNDVFILQSLLLRLPQLSGFSATGRFDAGTAAAVATFQSVSGLPPTGSLDAATAAHILLKLSSDGYKDDGKTAGSQGYLYKVSQSECSEACCTAAAVF